MQKQYRIDISTFWQHPNINFGKCRQQVYDFTTGTLVPDERGWFNGQDFYNPKRSPNIYVVKDIANEVYDELDVEMDDWTPLNDIIFEGSHETLISYRLVSVNRNGDEKIEAERNVPELLAMFNETAKQFAS
jgi:hypothetical protein